MKATLLKGWGFWETTFYPYGGDFHRAAANTPVTILGPGTKGDERKVQIDGGKRVAFVPLRGLKIEPQCDCEPTLVHGETIHELTCALFINLPMNAKVSQ